ncbi:MAG: hypothetical protein LUP99_04495 [Methanomicrobiales archaeon]|nr:hypothetical protein [Methanomicrobiales archaeon]
MDNILQSIHQVLSDLHVSLDRAKDIDRRVTELETTVSRTNSIIMDLKTVGGLRSECGDRLTTLEGMVNRLYTMTAEQKNALEHLIETHGKAIEDLKKDVYRKEQDSNESAIQEIEELVRRRS